MKAWPATMTLAVRGLPPFREGHPHRSGVNQTGAVHLSFLFTGSSSVKGWTESIPHSAVPPSSEVGGELAGFIPTGGGCASLSPGTARAPALACRQRSLNVGVVVGPVSSSGRGNREGVILRPHAR